MNPAHHNILSGRVAAGSISMSGALLVRHIREVERFATVRESDPGIAQADEVLALIIIVCVFGQSRHSSGRRCQPQAPRQDKQSRSVDLNEPDSGSGKFVSGASLSVCGVSIAASADSGALSLRAIFLMSRFMERAKKADIRKVFVQPPFSA
jgi:hypothetical protein